MARSPLFKISCSSELSSLQTLLSWRVKDEEKNIEQQSKVNITFWFNPVLLWIDKLFDDETIHQSLNQSTPFAERNGSVERKVIVGVSIIVQLFQRLDGSWSVSKIIGQIRGRIVVIFQHLYSPKRNGSVMIHDVMVPLVMTQMWPSPAWFDMIRLEVGCYVLVIDIND